MRARLTSFFDRQWYGGGILCLLLVPLSWVYRLLQQRHRARAEATRESVAVPVIVVGNLTVGGTGKTPVVIWLIQQLRSLGYRPGIITRGYLGSQTAHRPLDVTAQTDAAAAGDEAVLLAQALSCPVVACARRVDALELLLRTHDVNVVVSDDGLQHYALSRDVEIVVVDGQRGLGNERLLPAGPLREPAVRLKEVDLVLVNDSGGIAGQGGLPAVSRYAGRTLRFRVQPTAVTQLCDGRQTTLQHFSGSRVHAVAALGNPQRFFAMLEAAGCQVDAHLWPDHAPLPAAALQFEDSHPILVTRKDAVKFGGESPSGVWVVDIDIELSAADSNAVMDAISAKLGNNA